MSERVKGSTSVSLLFRLTDSTTGAAKAGVDVTTLKLQYERPGAATGTATSLTLLAALTTAWTSYGAKEVDATNSKGVYRVDAPDLAFATGADEVTLTVTGAGIEPSTRLIDLTGADMRNATTLGLTNLDATVSSRSTYAGGAVTSVTGAVGSVTGAVGSVTGNVGGNVSGSVASVTAAVTLPAIPANWLTAAGINAAALNGKGDWNTTTPPTTGAIAAAVAAPSAGTIATAVLTDVADTLGADIVSILSQTTAANIRAAIGIASANIDTQLAEIEADVDAIGAGTDPLTNPLGTYTSGTAGAALQRLLQAIIAVTGNVLAGGVVKIIQGDDYKAIDNRALPFSVPASSWGDLSAATISFVALHSSGSKIGPLTGSVTSGNTESQTILIPVLATDTAGKHVSTNEGDTYDYAVRATRAGDLITPWKGPLVLDRNLFA